MGSKQIHSDIPFSKNLFLCDTIEHQDRLERFLGEHSTWIERDKIRYLLDGMRTSEATFIRNRRQCSGKVAARWFRWKMVHPQYLRNPIMTARDFVERVTDRSRKTGRPYSIVFEDGTREELRTVLRNELEALETALMKRIVEKTIEGRSSKREEEFQESLSVPLLSPVT